MAGLPPVPEIEVPGGPPDRAEARRLVDSAGAEIIPATTEVSLGVTREGLTALFEVRSAPPLHVTKMALQDPVFEDECVELFWAGRGTSGYAEVVVNPLGTIYTARVFNPDGDRRTWNVSPVPFASASARIEGFPGESASGWERWSCRLFAGWADLTPGEPPPAGGEVHRGNLFRIARGREVRFEALSPTGRVPADFHVPSRFALFRFPDLM